MVVTETDNIPDFSSASERIDFSTIGRNLNCYFYPVDHPPPSLGRLNDFYQIWNQRRSDTLPAWKDFSFELFKGWHSYMRVMATGSHVDAEKKNLIAGGSFTENWGSRTFQSHIRDGTVNSKQVIKSYKHYHDLVHGGYYVINVGTLPLSGGATQAILMLDLPLSEDGDQVTHLIGAFVKLD